MSSVRNAVQRRNHKERGQIASRSKLGLLEKHSDYVLRARDYNTKQKSLRNLREKARARNPDEFYFKMINTQTKKGIQIASRTQIFTADDRKLLKSQDVSYIKHRRAVENNTIDRLKGSLQFISAAEGKHGQAKSSHTVFVDTEEDVATFDPAAHLDTPKELLARRSNRLRNADLDTAPIPSHDAPSLKKLHSQRSKSYKELAQRVERETKLATLEDELDIQRKLLSKGRRTKIGTDQRGLPIYKWKADRKK